MCLRNQSHFSPFTSGCGAYFCEPLVSWILWATCDFLFLVAFICKVLPICSWWRRLNQSFISEMNESPTFIFRHLWMHFPTLHVRRTCISNIAFPESANFHKIPVTDKIWRWQTFAQVTHFGNRVFRKLGLSEIRLSDNHSRMPEKDIFRFQTPEIRCGFLSRFNRVAEILKP